MDASHKELSRKTTDSHNGTSNLQASLSLSRQEENYFRVKTLHVQVEKILDHRPIGRIIKKIQYLCKWEGYGVEHNSWASGVNPPTIIVQYWEGKEKERKRKGVFSSSESEEEEADRSIAKQPVKKPRQDVEVEKSPKYSDLQIAQFLKIIERKENKPVWDSSHADFHNKETRNAIFKSVELECSKFMKRGPNHGDNAKKLWDQLLIAYKAEREKMKKMHTGSEKYKSKFEFFGKMSFLEPVNQKSGEISNNIVMAPSKTHAISSKRKSQNEENGMMDQCSSCQIIVEKPSKGNEDLHYLIERVIGQKNDLEKIQMKHEITKFLLDKIRIPETTRGSHN